MKESKLIEILKSFSPDEIRSFEKFVRSPYFSTGRDVSVFCSSLVKYYPGFDSAQLEKEQFFRKVFPGEEYSLKKLKNHSSDLTRLAEKFLVHSSIGQSKAEFEKRLADEYRKRNLEDLLAGTLRSLEKKTEFTNFSSVVCFSEAEKLERLKEEYFIGKHDFTSSVPSRIKYTDYFSLSFLVSFLRKLRDRSIIPEYYNLPFESMLQDAIIKNFDLAGLLKTLEKDNYEHHWLLKMYYCAYKCTQDPQDTASYDEFRNIFYGRTGYFSREEKYFIFNDFIAYCHRYRDVTGKEMDSELFDIQKHMLAENAFSPAENEYMSALLYRNIMNHSLDLDEIQWLENFIAEYSQYLNPEYMDNMKNLALANAEFSKGEFEKSLLYINRVQYDMFLFKSDVKNLSLKIYYELGLYEQAYSMIDAYRHYLTATGELSEYFKTQLGNFVNIYSKLLKARSSGNAGEAVSALVMLEKSSQVSSGGWLKRKLGELNEKGV